MGSERIWHFRQLRVYQQAFAAAMRIYELSKKWPREEQFSLTDQVRRSSRSICSCIAEAWRKRRYPAHFTSKLSDADTELAETQSWLDFAFACRYLERSDYDDLNQHYETISGGLVRMMSEPDKWCGPANTVSEAPAEYNPFPDSGSAPAPADLPFSLSPFPPFHEQEQ